MAVYTALILVAPGTMRKLAQSLLASAIRRKAIRAERKNAKQPVV